MGTMLTILDMLNFVLFAAGAFICLYAYRVNKKTGYLILVSYFVLSFVFFGIIRRTPVPSFDAEKLRRTGVNSTKQRIAVPVRRVELPIAHLLLVGGLWLIVRDTDAKETEGVKNESN